MLLRQFNWKREVVESAEPVLVDVCVPWSPPCRMMSRIVARIACDHKVCEVNIDAEPDLATALGIRAVPTLLIFKSGRLVAHHVGVTCESTLRAELAN